jgi:adenine-specific DNA-methyltransferase
MPTLEFKGKQYVYSHHHSVPFRELEVDGTKSLSARGKNLGLEDNLIIHGDNLHALKALMPRYAGKIKCIYIDPPYNTGNEGWCYNDNVNAPLMKEWIKKNAPIDKEDLERHDKWLCMMYPRLKLLHELLADDGVIFVSIDDNEMHRLRILLDDIFGEENFLGQISVLVNPKGRGLKDSDFAKTHEYLISYQGSKRKENIGKTKDDEKVEKEYKEFDADGKRHRTLELRNTHSEFGKNNRENLWYPFYVDKNLNISLEPQKGFEAVFPVWDDGFEGCWTWDQAKAKRDLHLIVAKVVKGNKKIYRMSYPDNKEGERVKQKIKTIWKDPLFFTEQGKADVEQAIPGCSFDTPKPVELIKEIISFYPPENLIVLDSFAGSGTTAQAVLSLNYIDGENRKFILVECEDYADSITAERIKRVIKGIPSANDA